MSSNRDLLTQWRAGDAAAGTELYERHNKAILGFFARLVYGTNDVEELVQETFIALKRSESPFRGEDPAFRAYLFGIAKNKFFEYLRKHDRRNRLVDPHADPERVAEVTAEDLEIGDPSAFVETREEHKLLLKAMRRIPIDHQLALHLSFWHELTNPQIAKILGIPVGTVAGRLRLGKERLHTKIDEFNADPALVESTRGMLKWYDDISTRAKSLVDTRLKPTP